MKGFDQYRRHVNPVLSQLEDMTGLSRKFVRADGCYLWDDDGEKYIDFISGHGAFNLGHNHPEIIHSIDQNIHKKLLQIYGFGASPYMGELAEKISRLAGEPFEIIFFSNSGTEAVEGALKMARAATKRSKIIYCNQAYHGMTMGSLSMMPKGPWREPFEPLLPDFISIPFNDLLALENVLVSNDCAGFILEPIQVEGGVNIPSHGYLPGVRELCDKYGALLIFDEISTGLGRTGSLFAFQKDGAFPDIFTLAKSLGGGIMPIGAYVSTRNIFDLAYASYEMSMSHHSTFGGNSLSCLTALRFIELLSSNDLMEKVRDNGAYFLKSLKDILKGYSLINDIRGKGLLIGIEFKDSDNPWVSWEYFGIPDFEGKNAVPSIIMKYLLKKNIITQICGHTWNVLKITPPLIIEREDIDNFISAMEEAMKWIETIV